MTNPVELKVKSKSLEAEAKIIRKEERKAKKEFRWNRDRQREREAKAASFRVQMLSHHRRWDVRNEARCTFIARAFLRGAKYKDVISPLKGRSVSWLTHYGDRKRVVDMIFKYGPYSTRTEAQEKFDAWYALTR